MKDNRHSLREDLLALIVGSCFVSLGVFFFNQTGLVAGGTAGLALLLQKITGLSFGQVFFLLNVPFYILAWLRMGKRFTVNTFISVSLVSVLVDNLDKVLQLGQIEPLYSAVVGGALIGVGMLMLFRHSFSLGGFNILCLYLQDKYGIRAGKVQMALDCTIVVCSFFVVPVELLGLSVFGVIIYNLVLTMNHKPGRYQVY